jgi:D-alanine-D-alanine ligase
MGGTASEHEISLRSGAEVLEHLDPERWAGEPVLWAIDGRWEIPRGSSPCDAPEALDRLRGYGVAFLALHGPGGEDGRVQGFLETAGIRYTGSGVVASALAMDKAAARAVARSCGLAVADGFVARRGGEILASSVPFPAVVKPVGAGSSADLHLVEDEAGLRDVLAEVLTRWSGVLVEAYVEGREVTGPVLEDPETGRPRALPPVEIRCPGRRLFDPEAKYVPGVAEEICPAPLDEETTRRVRAAARTMHEALGCRGVSRSDFILREGEPVFLETNTIPGLTRESLLPKAARAAGISMGELVDGLLRLALRKEEA